MKLLQETIDKQPVFQNNKQKQQHQKKQSVVYTSKQISKLNLKRLRIERMHTDVYTGSL